MSVVAAYHVFVCALFLVQGGMWTAVWSGAENLAPLGFDPRTVQPIASRYTAIPLYRPTWTELSRPTNLKPYIL
jgi:hypothetical protein